MAIPWQPNWATHVSPDFKFLTSRLSATITSSTYFVVFRVSLLYCQKNMKRVFCFCSKWPLESACNRRYTTSQTSLRTNCYCVPCPHGSFAFICYNTYSLHGTYNPQPQDYITASRKVVESLNLSTVCSWNVWVILPCWSKSSLAEGPLPYSRHIERNDKITFSKQFTQ